MYNTMRNLYLPNGEWAGQFIDEKTAKDWAKAKGYDLAKCEISTRKVERKNTHYYTAAEATEVINSGETLEL